MAFNPANFLPVLNPGYTSQMNVWKYSTADNLATVTTDGYFDQAYKFVRLGNYINVTASDGLIQLNVVQVDPNTPEVNVFNVADVTNFYFNT